MALCFFAGVLVVDCLVISAMKSAMRRLKLAEEKVKESEQQKVDFMNILAHELRTPLQIISNIAAIMKRKPESDMTDRADALERQARQMSRLVEDLLDSARANLKKLHLNLLALDLKLLLNNTVESLTPILDADRRTIRIDLPDGGVSLLGDDVRLTQVVENLITNASKFSPSGSEIKVALRTGAGLAYVSVSDQGRGMSSDQISKLFVMYAQSSSDDALKGGLGLGLCLAKRIIEMHGGNIQASSPGLGQGATFEFSIPLYHPSKDL